MPQPAGDCVPRLLLVEAEAEAEVILEAEVVLEAEAEVWKLAEIAALSGRPHASTLQGNQPSSD
jgi:hypothetical protein